VLVAVVVEVNEVVATLNVVPDVEVPDVDDETDVAV
jgi:hypothetical protein